MILIIDDEPLIRKALSRLLQAHGYLIEEAQNGQEGLQKIDQIPPHQLEYIFLDWLMPDMNGEEVLKQLQKRQIPLKKVIVITALQELKHSLAQQTRTILYKPFDDLYSILDLIR